MNKDKGYKLLKRSIDTRGGVLEGMVVVERQIDLFLAKYFTSSAEKTLSILNLVFCTDRITFYSKVQILDYILKNESEDKQVHKKLLTTLKHIIEQRNIFAHYLLYVTEDSLNNKDNELTYVKFKNEQSYETYTDESIQELHNKINYCVKELKEVEKNWFEI